jgi:transcription elongation factor GreA
MKINVTRTGLEKMQQELARMKGTEMREHLQALAEAREKGDISENAEYEVARDNINMLNIKISHLEERIRNSVVVSRGLTNTDKVQIFTKVTILNLNSNKEVVYSIVAEDEADSKLSKISCNSPLAQGLIGFKEGDVVSVKVPVGDLKLKILKIEPVE